MATDFKQVIGGGGGADPKGDGGKPEGDVTIAPLTTKESAQKKVDEEKTAKSDAAIATEKARVETYTASPDFIDIDNRLKTQDAAAIDSWIDGGVNDLAQAKTALKAIVKYMVRIGRQ